MPQFAAISPERHSVKSWKRFTSYGFAATDNLLQLVGAELAKAAFAMPIAFIRNPERHLLVGVTSLQPGKNLYVGPDGRWLGAYIPAVLRGYPFRLVTPEGSEQSILCIDEESGLLGEGGEGEPFFDEDGQPSRPLKEILDFLSQTDRNRAATQQAVDALAEAGVLVPWELQVKQGEETTSVTGLLRVDEGALAALDDDAFLKLRRASALPVAYAQLLSMERLALLEHLVQMQEKLAAPTQQARMEEALANLGGFTLSQNDELLKFS